MNEQFISHPPHYNQILEESKLISFSMSSDLLTGSLLRTLVRSKPAGNFLEIGTGTGLSLAFIAEGMDDYSRLISIDNDALFQSVAKKYFSSDSRIKIITGDGGEWIISHQTEKFDLIFADAWPGKYNTLDETIALLKTGGLYVIDDLLPQPNWPEGHEQKAKTLIEQLRNRKDLELTCLNWSTGIIVAARK